jgi:hypothetical protein
MKITKIYLTFILLIAFMGVADAQSREERREQRKQERLERRQLKKAQRAQEKARIIDMAEEQAFVLEANTLFDRYMNRYDMVNNSFIMLRGDEMVLQTATPGGHPGFNGMGGITLNGRITDYEIHEGKKQRPVTITAQVNTQAVGHGTIRMTISGSGNATGTFRDNWGNRITFSGRINDLQSSSVFEGMSVFG